MKILFVTHYSEMYGANRSLIALLEGIKKYSEIYPFVFAPRRGEITKCLDELEIPYFVLPFKWWMAPSRLKSPFRLFINICVLPLIIKKVKKINIDLIYTNSSVTPIGAWTAYFTKLPHIWHIREFGWLDYKLKYDLGRKVFEYWLNKANRIVTVSNSIKEEVLTNVQVPVNTIYNGVISEEKAEKLFQLYPKRSGDDKTILGIIGLLHPTKGQEQAIKALSKVSKSRSDIYLHIAGTGEAAYESYLKDLCAELNVSDRVIFLGYVNNPFEFYSQIDVALICSKNEGMGRVTAEAMVAGKLIIGLDNAGTSELIEHEQNGLLYNGSDECLVNKIEYCINNELSDLAVNAREKGIHLFTIEHYAMQVKNTMEKVLQYGRL